MHRAFLCFVAAILIAVPVFLIEPSSATAQEGEARVLFESGNAHLARGMRGTRARRQRELSAAIDDYLGVLRLGARTRNVIFNLGLASQGLGRDNDAFNYFSEYLRAFDLSAEDRAAGTERLEALRSEVAVVTITSTPAGAEVRIDRSDLPARGSTPIELAVEPGEHRVLLTRSGFQNAEQAATAVTGQTASVTIPMTAEPVMVQVIAPADGELTLDGNVIAPGHAVPVQPGDHVARLALTGAPPVELRFEVLPGADPMTLEMQRPAGTLGGSIHVAVDPASVSTVPMVFVDDVQIGTGPMTESQLTPGPHRLEVLADGHADAMRGFRIAAGQTMRFNVTMGEIPDRTGIYLARAFTGIIAAGGLITSGILGIDSLIQNGAWEGALEQHNTGPVDSRYETTAELLERADRLESTLLATDISFSITAAVGITAIIVAAVDDGGEDSVITVGAAADASGGFVSVGGRL